MLDELDHAIAAEIKRLNKSRPEIGWAWSVKQGRYQIQDVQFPKGKRGRSVVAPLTDWMNTREEVLAWFKAQ
jgi:hypothetical protein